MVPVTLPEILALEKRHGPPLQVIVPLTDEPLWLSVADAGCERPMTDEVNVPVHVPAIWTSVVGLVGEFDLPPPQDQANVATQRITVAALDNGNPTRCLQPPTWNAQTRGRVVRQVGRPARTRNRHGSILFLPVRSHPRAFKRSDGGRRLDLRGDGRVKLVTAESGQTDPPPHPWLDRRRYVAFPIRDTTPSRLLLRRSRFGAASRPR